MQITVHITHGSLVAHGRGLVASCFVALVTSVAVAQPTSAPNADSPDRPPIVHEYVNFTPAAPTPEADSSRRADETNAQEPGSGGSGAEREGSGNTGQAAATSTGSDDIGGEASSAAGADAPTSATLPDRATLDDDTDSASGEPYDELYEPTVRPHKRSQVLERIVFEAGVLQLAEAPPRYTPAQAETSSSPLRVRRRAEIVIDELDTWYRLPTTTPDMLISGIESGTAVQLRRTDTGLYEVRVPTSAAAISGPVPVTLRTSEAGHYSEPFPEDARLARPPGYRELPPQLLREVGAVLRSIPAIETTDEAREDTLAQLTAYFRSFQAAPLSSEDPTRSLFYRTVTQKLGVCRHRAFGFVMLAQALGIRARYVANELHAFAEVQAVDGRWFRVDLGGLVEPNGEQSEHTPASQPATPPVESAERAAAQEEADPSSPSAESDAAQRERTEIRWAVDRKAAYRGGDALVFSGKVDRPPGIVSLVLRSTVDEREVQRTTEVSPDGQWRIRVVMDSHWSVGSVAVNAYFHAERE